MDFSLFKNKNFIFLWIAGLCTSFSLSIYLFTQIWYVVEVMDLEASLGIIMIGSSIPRLIFMLIGGVFADQFSKKNIMFLTSFIRGSLLILLTLALLFDVISLWVFLVFSFLFGILDAFFWSADNSIIPEIVEVDNLTRANSIVQMTNQSSFILGPMIGGIIISFGEYTNSFVVTAILLFIGAVLTRFIKSLDVKKEREKNTKLIKSLKEGFSYVKETSFLIPILSISVMINFLMVGPLQMGLPLFVKQILNGSSLTFSWLEGSMALGMLVGSIVIGYMNIKQFRVRFAYISLFFACICFILLAFSRELWQSIAVIFLFGVFLPMGNIPLFSFIQSNVDGKMVGRVMSMVSFSSMGLIPLSYGVTSILLTLGIPIYIIMGTGAMLVCVSLLSVFVFSKNVLDLDQKSYEKAGTGT